MLILFFGGCVTFVTILGRDNGYFKSELELFWSYKELFNGDIQIGKQIILNIAMFVPFGFLIASLFQSLEKNHTSIITVFVGALYSTCIEIIQYKFSLGTFEVDDILDNTLGAFIGALTVIFLHKMCHNKKIFYSIIVCIGTICVAVGIWYCVNYENQSDIERNIGFQVDSIRVKENQLKISGFAMKYGMDAHESGFSNMQVVLKSTNGHGNVIMDTEYGIPRVDVNKYFKGKFDYTYTGYKATAQIEPNEEYAVCLKLPDQILMIDTNVYVCKDELRYVSQSCLDNPQIPNVKGTDLKRICTPSNLRVYRPDFHCWVYQYNGHLYWIVDKYFDFEEDGSTYIQYQLWTTQKEKLPKERLDHKVDWDNIGGDFEAYEITDNMDCGEYRVCKRELPTEYAITSIITGYYKNGHWIWNDYFRPYYDNL